MKKPISADAARIYLQGALADAQQSACQTCKFPAPFWGPGVGPGSGYWYIKMPPSCPSGCLPVIVRVWSAFTMEFEIQREPYDAASHREERTRFQRLTSSGDAPRRRQNER